MKKITFFTFLACGFAFAQSPTSFTELLSNSEGKSTTNTTIENAQAVIIRVNNNLLPVIDTYTSMVDFDAAVAVNCQETTLTFEDFAGGPGVPTINCGVVVNSDGGDCFVPGEIQEGIAIRASNDTVVISISAGLIGNTDPLIGANSFLEFSIIEFQEPVFAVALDIFQDGDPSTTVRIFSADGLLETFDVATPLFEQVFFGVIADEAITSIEIEGANDSGELFGNLFFGADCEVLSVSENLQELISISPNPALNLLSIRTPSSISLNSVVVYDTLGKAINVSLTNNQINISSLNSGVYFLQINTAEGSLTKKFIKK